ncbi:hypothetical protein CDCA_CDCA01G0116 [Cyanidium caldarium]|uniref:PAS domain-containing protein n=1 Tax=Cyanidium caldarium TaxID=2771 RepID=A0AAV9IPU4_CYACA|nr:hypothetical protein CDCA_CDCA01G0116 [Cyanidium caldarium]
MVRRKKSTTMTTTPFSPDRLSAEARRRLVHALTSFRERFSLSRREWATHSSDELVDEAADAITWLVKAYDEAVAVFNNHSPAGIPKRVRFAEVSNDDATAPTPNQAKVDGSEVSAVAPTDAPGLSPPSSMPLGAEAIFRHPAFAHWFRSVFQYAPQVPHAEACIGPIALHALLASRLAVVRLSSASGRLLEVFGDVEKLYGRKRSDLLGLSVWFNVHDDDVPRVQDTLSRMMRAWPERTDRHRPCCQVMRLRRVCGDQRVRWVLWIGLILNDWLFGSVELFTQGDDEAVNDAGVCVMGCDATGTILLLSGGSGWERELQRYAARQTAGAAREDQTGGGMSKAAEMAVFRRCRGENVFATVHPVDVGRLLAHAHQVLMEARIYQSDPFHERGMRSGGSLAAPSLSVWNERPAAAAPDITQPIAYRRKNAHSGAYEWVTGCVVPWHQDGFLILEYHTDERLQDMFRNASAYAARTTPRPMTRAAAAAAKAHQ